MKDCFDREITYLRLSVTDLCNLRCRYCMPEQGIRKKPHDSMLTEEEMIAAVEVSASLGVTKLRITGGEPLVKPNILSICRRAAAVAGIAQIGLTTNGILLPDLAKPLRDAGVDRVNISLDTLHADKYAAITRCGRLDDALRGLEAALDAGFSRVKLNAVLIGGFNDDEITDLAALTLRYPIDVRFIELMPMPGSSAFPASAYLSADRVLEALPALTPAAHDGGVAALYRLPGAQGNVGLIRPISAHFCANCNRIRLTADGRIKPCLHSEAEYSIKGLPKEEMAAVFARAIACKPRWHGQLSADARSRAARSMHEIGG